MQKMEIEYENSPLEACQHFDVYQSKSIDDCPASSESDIACASGVSCAGKRRSLHSVSENHSEVHRAYHNLLNFLTCVFTIVIPETSVCKLYFAKLS